MTDYKVLDAQRGLDASFRNCRDELLFLAESAGNIGLDRIETAIRRHMSNLGVAIKVARDAYTSKLNDELRSHEELVGNVLVKPLDGATKSSAAREA